MKIKCFIVIVLFSLLGCASYKAHFTGEMNFKKIEIENSSDFIFLRPTDKAFSQGIMFYPGGLVEPDAYIKLFSLAAARGYPVVILKMPFNLAVFDINKGRNYVKRFESVTSWVLAGHSLGGAMAVTSVKENPGLYKGLILMAAYPPEDASLADLNIPVLSLYAENDGLATLKKIDQARPLLPPGTKYFEISGGNHAGFGSYGPQDKDGLAEISEEEQHGIILKQILLFFENYVTE